MLILTDLGFLSLSRDACTKINLKLVAFPQPQPRDRNASRAVELSEPYSCDRSAIPWHFFTQGSLGELQLGPARAGEQLLGEGALDPLLVAVRSPASVADQVAIDLGDC